MLIYLSIYTPVPMQSGSITAEDGDGLKTSIWSLQLSLETEDIMDASLLCRQFEVGDLQ